MDCQALLDTMGTRGLEENQEIWGLLVLKDPQERMGLQELKERLDLQEIQGRKGRQDKQAPRV